jgi:predicted dehydrogenase
MPAGKPIGIGLAGTGSWARGFWDSAAGCPDVHLVACYDPRPESASDFAARFGCPSQPSLESLVAHPAVEAVAVFTPNSFHRRPTELAAAAGKHVFTEKPIANTIEDAAAMIRACDSARVTLMVGHSARYSPASRALKSALDAGRLGQPIMVEGNSSHSGGARLSDREWRWHRDEAPGGPLMQLAIHTFDTLHYLLGPIRRATALSDASLLPSEIEDVFVCLLEFHSGLLGYVGTNYASPSVSYLRLYGRRANALASGHHLTLTLADQRNPWETTTEETDLPPLSPHAAEMAEFARALRTASPPETGAREGLLALGVVWACLTSAQRRCPVDVREALGDAASLHD